MSLGGKKRRLKHRKLLGHGVLADVLAAGGIQIAEKADPLLFQAKRDLRNKIRSKSEYRIRLLRESDKQQYKKTEEELRDLAVRYNDIEAQIGSSNLSAATFSKPLSLLDMQALLDPDSMVLEYSLGKEASYLWLITQDSFTFFELPARREIELAAKNLYGAISKPESRPQEAGEPHGSLAFEKAATHLADMVLRQQQLCCLQSGSWLYLMDCCNMCHFRHCLRLGIQRSRSLWSMKL